MIDKTELPDPTSVNNLSEREKEIVEDAHDAGNNPEFINTDKNIGGELQQTVNPEAIEADQTGAAGGDSDVSGGVANLDEIAGKIVGENEYND